MRGPAKTVEIKLLGPFRQSGSYDLPKKAQALLAYLAMNRGRAISRDQLADLLWSTSGPEQGRQSLRQILATVRRALGADARGLVETVGTDVLLAASGAVDIDVQRFETLAQSTATADLAAASALYRGEFLADFDVPSEPFMDWVRVERTRLEATACGMLLRLAAALSDAGEHDAAIAAAERLIALDPLREDGHRLLMQLFASVGRRAEAVRQFAMCKDSLRRQLDVAPDAKTVALAQAIQAEGPAQPLAASGATPHAPAAGPAEAETPASAARTSDHVHDIAGEAGALPLPMEAGATRGRAVMPAVAAPAAAEDTAAAETIVTAEGLPQAPGPKTLADARQRATSFLRPPRSAGWIWASGLSVLAVAVAALALLRTSSGPTIAAVPTPNDERAPAAAASQVTEFVNTAAALQPAAQKATPDQQRFDGTWTSMIACSAAKGAAEYTIPLEAEVKDGVYHAERGVDGKPNRLTLDGIIQLDGSAELLAQGLTGDSVYTVARDRPGSLYAYHIRAKFEGSRGTGSRVELRPCTFTALKR